MERSSIQNHSQHYKFEGRTSYQLPPPVQSVSYVPSNDKNYNGRDTTDYHDYNSRDDNNPNADWSGETPQPNSRKHLNGRAHAVSLVHDPITNAIRPADTASTTDYSTKGGLKTFYNNNRQARETGQNVNPNVQTDSYSSSFSLFGGPTDERRHTQSSMYETTAQSAASGEHSRTSIDQRSSRGAKNYGYGGVKQVSAMYENNNGGSSVYDPNTAGVGNPYNNFSEDGGNQGRGQVRNDGEDSNNLIGYRQTHGGRQPSLVQGLAASISSTLQAPAKRVVIAPYATDGNTKTDPYSLDDGKGGRMSKDMFRENYESRDKGFRGRRGDEGY